MIESYLSFFAPAPFKVNTNNPTGSQVNEVDRNQLIGLLGSNSVEKLLTLDAPIIISGEAVSKNAGNAANVKSVISVVEPDPGVMVKKENISYLSQYRDMDQRISMVKIDAGITDIDSSKLANLLSEVEKKSPNIVNIINNAGAASSEGISLIGQVELGGYRGGDFIFDNEGNIIGQQYNGPVDRVQNETTNSLSIQTKSGSDVTIEFRITDQMNGQGLQGAAREIALTYASSQELSEEEISELNKILDTVQNLSASFHGSYSVQQSDVKALDKSIQETSDFFESVNISLNFESGNFQRNISMSSTNNDFTVNVSEKGMNDAYIASYRNSSYLKINMNEVQTISDKSIEKAINRNEYNPYQEAIITQETLNYATHGSYISSIFETSS